MFVSMYVSILFANSHLDSYSVKSLMWSLCKDISHGLHLGALQVGPLFSQLPPLLQKLKVRRSARLIADAASYPYSENYHWWYGVDFVKRLFVIKFATFQYNTNVSIFTVTLIMYTT